MISSATWISSAQDPLPEAEIRRKTQKIKIGKLNTNGTPTIKRHSTVYNSAKGTLLPKTNGITAMGKVLSL